MVWNLEQFLGQGKLWKHQKKKKKKKKKRKKRQEKHWVCDTPKIAADIILNIPSAIS